MAPETRRARKGATVDEATNRQRVEKAFRDWQDGSAT
jgi:hypothetical protein